MRILSLLLAAFACVALAVAVDARVPNPALLKFLPVYQPREQDYRIRPFWGKYGHAAVASIAQTMLSPSAISALQTLLPEVNGELAPIASWADDIRENPAYAWSKPLHFINTPDWACTYERKRDCIDSTYGANYCVDAAIQNYTARTLNSQIGAAQQNEAIKFLVHFVGDVHQPLHCGFIGDEGGNSIVGTYYTRTDERLHAVWDDGLIYTRVDNDYGGSNDTWVSALISTLQAKPNLIVDSLETRAAIL